MYNPRFEKETFKKEVKHNVKTLYRKTIEEATPQQLFQAVSYAVKEVIIDDWIATQNQFKKDDPKTQRFYIICPWNFSWEERLEIT